MGETDTRRAALKSRGPRALRRFGPLGGIGLAVILALPGSLLWLGYRELSPAPVPETPTVYRSLDRLLSVRPLAAGRPSRSGVPVEELQSASVLAFGSSDAAIEVARATVEIERAQAEGEDEADLHVQGLLRGSEGRLDEAVVLLEGAHLQDPKRADVLSDLAAVRLSRFKTAGDPEDLFQALAAAEHSLELEPDSPSALFNRALALSRLHTKSQATAAWEAYLNVDATEPWSGTAREELEGLRQPTLEDRWEGVRERLLSPAPGPSEQEIREAVGEFPHRARMLVLQELLPKWGRAWREGDRVLASRWMECARAVGLSLETETGDVLISQTIATTDEAAFGLDHAAVARQAGAYEFLGRALDLIYEERRPMDAAPLLLRAEKLLRSSGDPLGALPRFHLASALQHSDPVRSADEVMRLRQQLPEARYPQLSGFCDWVLGTIESFTGDSEQALRYFRSAQEKLHRSASDYAESTVHVLLAEAHRLLGQEGAARREYLRGLGVAARVGDRYRYHTALYPVVEMLVEREGFRPALSLSEELVTNAVAEQSPQVLAEAYLQRGRARFLMEDLQGAGGDFGQARRFANEMPVGALRDRTAATLELAEAELLLAEDPAAAVALLGRALESKLETGYLYHLTRTFSLRGRAHLARGAVEEGRRDFLAVVEEFERLRGASESHENRRSTFELAQQTFDELLRLEVENGAPPERSLALAERSRSREMTDLLGNEGLRDDPAMELPSPGLAFVEYSVLPDRLLIWLVSENGVTFQFREVTRENLQLLLKTLRNAVSRRASEQEIQSALAPLYDLLIAPIAPQLLPEAVLAVVPDRFLAGVPFSALYDRDRGRYLIEDHPVTLSPAIGLYPALRDGRVASRRIGSGAPRRALIIGDPEVDRELYPELQALRAARDEAVAVSRLYPESRLLLGPEATAEAFLREAPGYEVIQFSGHARANLRDPGGSSLILAPSANRNRALAAAEIAGLDLRGTALVVLSACSALDADRGGRESVTGLAAAFFAAGVPVVVASLWEVDDRVSGELMTRFHRAVAEGAEPVTALREAQVALMRGTDPLHRSPATWGAFSSLGEAAQETAGALEPIRIVEALPGS